MALKQIFGPGNTLFDASGKLLKNCKLYFYSPGTDTKITTYSDSGLVNANTNPVIANGGGRATVWLNSDADLRIEDKDGNLIDTSENINPDDLTSSSDSGLIPNGSFETDANSDGIPDGWTNSDESGATNAIDNTKQTDGVNSFKFSSTGVGGGSLITDDFFPVNDADNLIVQFDVEASDATVHNTVEVLWYDAAQSSISTSAAYDSTSNPTTFTNQTIEVTPPSGARFAKLNIIGIDPDTPKTADTWYDKVKVFYPQVLAGVFDNITIQNNEIISTNTNGDINLNPDGTGKVAVDSALETTGTITSTGLVTAEAGVAFNSQKGTGLAAGTASTDAARIDQLIPATTAALFMQAAAPTGWTKSTSHNNKALRIVSGSGGGTGGGNPFTTSFNSARSTSTVGTGASVNGHTLSIGEIPSHNHPGSATGSVYATNTAGAGLNLAGTPVNAVSTAVNVAPQGGGGSHSHGLTDPGHAHTTNLDVQYVDAIICTKDAY